jgi:DNA-binding response OmpR family regulator
MSKESRPRVLVVDNDENTANTLVMVLDLWGYDARVCCDGAAVLETALTYLPHVLLLDIGLPGIDGFQVAHSLHPRPEFADLAIIGISGHGQESFRVRALAAGFDHYLKKPVDPDELEALLGETTLQPAKLVSPWGVNHLSGAIS